MNEVVLWCCSAILLMVLTMHADAQVHPLNAELEAALAIYDRGDFPAALAAFERVGERGHPEARYMAGLMHHRGRGTPVHAQHAKRWYERAAEDNHPAALANLGVLLRDGLGEGETAVPQDPDGARNALRRAAYLENVPGQLAFAAMLLNERRSESEWIEGVAFMRIAAAAGDEIAIENLKTLRVTEAESEAAEAKRAEIKQSIAAIQALRARGSATAGSTTQRGPLRLTRRVIKDPMINDCDALSLLVPVGWDFKGQIEWLLNDSVLTNLHFRITDPESRLQVGSLPVRQFTWSEGNTMPIGARHLGMIVLPPIKDPAEFVQRFWASESLPHLQGQTPTSIRELPALADLALREWGGSADVRAYALRYTLEHEGNVVEQELRFALLYAQNSTTWTVTRAHAVAGAKGTIDRMAPIVHAIYASAAYTSEWQAGWRICYGIFLRRARAEIVEARKLAAALQEHRAQMDEIKAGIERDREASTTARHRALQEALGGIETWTDPWQNQRLELPQGYREAWVNQQGEVLLSDQPGFDPHASNTRIEGDWKKSEKVDPMAGRR